ncbi:MAG: ECF-type sigma factor [Bacteroidota bacterium]
MASASEITALLDAHSDGDAEALDQLLPLVYDELRRIAHRHLGRGRSSDTIHTTALVHEAYLKLANGSNGASDRTHFFAVASTAMRHVLVDYARRRSAQKRGGGAYATTLDEGHALAVDARVDDVLALDEALTRLALLDQRLARVVEMRFFGGMDVDEVARALGVSDRTVKRDWRKARAVLQAELAST